MLGTPKFTLCKFGTRTIISVKKGVKLVALPFVITKKRAQKILHENEGFFEKDIKDIEGKFSGKLEKAFIPMHTASIYGVYTSYHVKYGIDRTEWETVWHTDSKGRLHAQLVPVIVTDWHHMSGTTPNFNYDNNDIQSFHKYADFEYPTDFVEKIVRIDELREKCEEIVTDTDVKVYTHEKKISFAIDQIFDNLREFEKNRLISIIKQKTIADHVEIKTMNLIMDTVEIKPFSYHVPVYLYHTEVDGRKICKMINGYNGSYAGDYVVSEIKFGITGTIIGGLLGIASFYMFPATSVYATSGAIGRMLFLRAGVGAFFSGLFSAFGSKFYGEYKYDNARNVLNLDKNENVLHEETHEDIQRRLLASNSVSLEYIKFQKEFDLLGLDLEEVLTIELLKSAKIKKLKQYHPDLNPVSKKETCNILTEQVIGAYNVLEPIAKK